MDRTLNRILVVLIVMQGALAGWLHLDNATKIAAVTERQVAQEQRMDRFADFAVRTNSALVAQANRFGTVEGKLIAISPEDVVAIRDHMADMEKRIEFIEKTARQLIASEEFAAKKRGRRR